MVVAVSTAPNPKPSSHQVRPPLLHSEGGNGAGRRTRAREVTSRYMSSSSSSNSFGSGRSASPLVSRTAVMTPMPNAVKRAQSVERRTPSSRGGGAEVSAASRMLVASTRSLSVSFQGESVALQMSKSKPVPSPNVRKGTPERRRPSPVRGGKGDGVGPDQMENLKPADQQRWSMTSNIMNRSVDLGRSGNAARSLQHCMTNETPRASIVNRSESKSGNGKLEPSDSTASDSESVSSGSSSEAHECGGGATQSRGTPRGIIIPARFLQENQNRVRPLPEPKSPQLKSNGLKASAPIKLVVPKKFVADTPASSPRGIPACRGLSSPSKLAPSLTSSPLRRTPSPSRTRNHAVSTLSNNLSNFTTPRVLNFAAGVRRGKVGESRIIDAHLLRALSNQHLQWRFVNARADASMLAHNLTAEKCLYDAWVATSELRDSVRDKRKELQFLQRNLRLTSILTGQMLYLEEWALLGMDHSTSLSGAIKALEASTLRLPVGGGTMAHVQSVKDAIRSAADVMQAMAASICTLLPKVEKTNSFVAELANITKQERNLLNQCKDLLSAVTAMQVKDSSLQTHVLQVKQVPSTLTATE